MRYRKRCSLAVHIDNIFSYSRPILPIVFIFPRELLSTTLPAFPLLPAPQSALIYGSEREKNTHKSLQNVTYIGAPTSVQPNCFVSAAHIPLKPVALAEHIWIPAYVVWHRLHVRFTLPPQERRGWLSLTHTFKQSNVKSVILSFVLYQVIFPEVVLKSVHRASLCVYLEDREVRALPVCQVIRPCQEVPAVLEIVQLRCLQVSSAARRSLIAALQKKKNLDLHLRCGN